MINLYHLQLQYEDAGNCLELIEKGEGRPKYLTQSGERLFDAFKTIQDFLNERFSDIASLKKFVVFLLNKTSFIRIETYDIADALKIFETINQRGKGLDPMDLLKNMILYLHMEKQIEHSSMLKNQKFHIQKNIYVHILETLMRRVDSAENVLMQENGEYTIQIVA